MIVGERDTTQRLTPYVTYGIICLNVIIFFYEFSLPADALNTLINNYGSIPKNVINWERSHTLFTSQFLHGGFLHLFSNLLVFWFIGDDAEDVFGHVGFLIVYLIAGVVGNIVHAIFVVDFLIPIWDPTMAQDWAAIPGIGASGAIFGVLAIYAINYPKRRLKLWLGTSRTYETSAWSYTLLYASLEFILAFVEGLEGGIALVHDPTCRARADLADRDENGRRGLGQPPRSIAIVHLPRGEARTVVPRVAPRHS